MLDKLQPGMEKAQVQFIMGTPTIVDPFRTDRWDYLYTFSKSGGTRKQRHIVIYFEDDKLAYLEGGVVQGIRKPPEEYRRERKTVDVPLETDKEGFFSKLVNVLPFVGDDEDKRPEIESTDSGLPADAPPETETPETAQQEVEEESP